MRASEDDKLMLRMPLISSTERGHEHATNAERGHEQAT